MKSPKADSLQPDAMGCPAFNKLINFPFFFLTQQYHYMFEASEDLALNWGLLLHDDFIGEKGFFLLHHLTIGPGSSASAYTLVYQNHLLIKALSLAATIESWPVVPRCLGCMCTVKKLRVVLAIGLQEALSAIGGGIGLSGWKLTK